MPYLICEKCGGHYKLQKGESPDDFGECTCGGRLRYVKSIYGDSKSRNKEISTKMKFTFGIFIIFIITLGLTYVLIPDTWKMDYIIPNKVGGYEVPKTPQELEFRAGSFYDEPVKVMGTKGEGLAKYYLNPNSNVMIIAEILNTDNAKMIKKMKLMYEGLPEETRDIDGKTVDLSYDGIYHAVFYGNSYVMDIHATSTNPSARESRDVLQREALNFTQNFIPEFNKKNIFYS